MKTLRKWIRRNKNDIVTWYIIIVTILAVIMTWSSFKYCEIIKENNLGEYFYHYDIPAEEL